MILSSKARYAVMAMVELARRGGTVTLAELAEAQEIAQPYLEQIFARLRQQDLVASTRGPGGGYALAHPAGAIAIIDIVRAMDERLKATRCASEHKGCMTQGARCLTHDLWNGLERQIEAYLAGITLAELVKPQGDAACLRA